MNGSTLTRIAPTKPEAGKPRPGIEEEARKEAADRAFEDGVRWFLAVSRRALAA